MLWSALWRVKHVRRRRCAHTDPVHRFLSVPRGGAAGVDAIAEAMGGAEGGNVAFAQDEYWGKLRRALQKHFLRPRDAVRLVLIRALFLSLYLSLFGAIAFVRMDRPADHFARSTLSHTRAGGVLCQHVVRGERCHDAAAQAYARLS